MTTPINLRENIIGVVLPDDAYNVRMGKAAVIKNNLYYSSKTLYDSRTGVELPPANYRFICLSNSATEEDAANPVEHNNDGLYRDYLCRDYQLHTALESLQSLLKSVGLEGKNVAILEIIK